MSVSARTDLEFEIFGWFTNRYPDGLTWTSENFHCFRDAPLELRTVISTDKIEFEIANGGLPQLLWNTYFHWRNLFADCEAGYGFYGAERQRSAIQEFTVLFEQHEAECRCYIDRCVHENDFSWFNNWCEHASPAMASENEKLFYTDSGIDELRQKWLQQNKTVISNLISA